MGAEAAVESHRFQAETTQLLQLVIHSLYTQREIFLRELISNGSDALDRLRFESLTAPDLVPAGHQYEIRLEAEPQARTLTVSDSGIGMSRQELIENIGTIARSGTQELRRRLQEAPNAAALGELIGQFGVGFYSAFMVADQVTIVTRRAGESAATRWDSGGDGTFTVSEATRAGCGTDAILRLKAVDAEHGMEDYTDRYVLTSIVHKYSDFIPFPIVYEGPAPAPEAADGGASLETAVLNSSKPIWTRRRSEVSESDLAAFYRQISHDRSEPLKALPLRAEGAHEYEALLFIPAQAPSDIFYSASEAGLRLYARRVMVMERCEDLLPRYLRFVKGVVDAADLPLNVSRQRLQQDRHVTQIRKWLTRRVLDALGDMQRQEPDAYLKFWREFGRVLKEGVGGDRENREKLLPLLLFESSFDPQALTTLKNYVERMKPDQAEILYLTGDSRPVIERSPHLEAVRSKGYEILYLSDPVDELLVGDLDGFEGRRLKSVSKGRLQVGTEEEQERAEEQLKQKEVDWKPFLEAAQRKLDQHVKQMRLTSRLVDSPACLVTEEHEFSPRLERLLQKGKGGGAKQRRIMELNPAHPIVERLYQRFGAGAEDPVVGESMELLFELALLAEGSDIADRPRFADISLGLLRRIV